MNRHHLGLVLAAAFAAIGFVAMLVDEKLQHEKKSVFSYFKVVTFQALLGYSTAFVLAQFPSSVSAIKGGAVHVASLPGDLLRGPAPF